MFAAVKPWTFALVKPDGVANPIAVRWLLSAARCEGLVITNGCRMLVTPDLAQQLYSEHQGAFYYGRLIRHICSGPSVAMRMELREHQQVQSHDDFGDHDYNVSSYCYTSPSSSSTGQQQQQRMDDDPLEAINRWRTLLGPSRLFANIYLSECTEFDQIRHRNFRQMFALSDTRNMCHGADSLDSLYREFSLFEANMRPVEQPEIELFALDAYSLEEEDYRSRTPNETEEEEAGNEGTGKIW